MLVAVFGGGDDSAACQESNRIPWRRRLPFACAIPTFTEHTTFHQASIARLCHVPPTCRSLAAALLALLSLTIPIWGQTLEPRPLFVEGYTDQLSYRPGDEVALHVSTTAGQVQPRDRPPRRRARGRADEEGRRRQGASRSRRTPRRTAAAGRRRSGSRSRPTGSRAITTSGLSADDRAGVRQRDRRTAASPNCSSSSAPAEPGTTSEDPAAALHQHLQRLQQLGRLQPLRLPRPGQAPGPPRLVRPAARRRSSTTGKMPFVAWAERTATRSITASTPTSSSTPSCSSTTSSCLSVGHDEYWSTPDARQPGNVHRAAAATSPSSAATPAAGRSAAKTSGRRPDLLEAVRSTTTRSSKPATTAAAHHALEPPPGRPAREPAHRRRLPLGRLSPSHGQFMDGPGAFTVHRPEHWLFAGTEPEARRRVRRQATRSSATSATAANSR